MDLSCFRCQNCPASDIRRPEKTGPLPDPTHSGERWAVTTELPGRLERKTSPRRVETVGQRPRDRAPLLRDFLEEEIRKGWASRLPDSGLAARVLIRQPAKRQSPENRPHSAHLSALSTESPEQSPGSARLEAKKTPADSPARRFLAQSQKARASRPHSARLLARSRPETPSRPAELRRTHSPAAQSLPDRGLLPRRAIHCRPSARLRFPAPETTPASRPLSDHLYSWYWSTFTFSSTPMASSVRTAIEQ